VISPAAGPDNIVGRGNFTVENPCGNSGTPNPAANPVVPYLSFPRIRESMIQKCRTGPEALNGFPGERTGSQGALVRKPESG